MLAKSFYLPVIACLNHGLGGCFGPILLTGWFLGGCFEADAAGNLLPPPRPLVAPLIGKTYSNDANGDRVDDELLARLQQARTAYGKVNSPNQTTVGATQLDAMLDVELIFQHPITQKQIDDFLKQGGEITHIYKAVSYGWNGRVPLSQVDQLPALMGGSLALVEEARPAQMFLDLATRTGRVRPVWSPGFAGNPNGFSGDESITIAIVDSGIDATHADLSGRGVFWQDYSTDAAANPIDISQHGSHVSSIAFGTGEASGSAEGTLYGTLYGNLSGLFSNNFVTTPMELPTNSILFTAQARWIGGGNGTLELLSHNKGGKVGYTVEGSVATGPSLLSLSVNVIGSPAREYSPALVSNGSMTNYVITYQVPQYPAVDGFNRLRGVAPGCNWAAAKVFTDNGSGLLNWTAAAVDDLVANRIADNIKVMNLSLGATGSPGISTSTRQKINTAVNNGIVVTSSAGNDGLSGPATARETDDPGRAAMTLTVAAANDINQLTDYSSQGFGSPSTTPGQEEDYKPDLMAPGGSSYYSDILAADSNSGDGQGFDDQQTNDYWSIQGTSVAAPFAAGAAALVIDALQQNGLTWDFSSAQCPMLVKMLLCATATESNTNRESFSNNPTLQRAANGTNGFPAGKDQYEGYGMINPDAAVGAASQSLIFGLTNSFALGPMPTDARAWARKVNLPANEAFAASLTVPGSGDFDLYLYSATPGLYGKPIILSSSTQPGNGQNENLTYTSPTNSTAYLVVKRIGGSGSFDLLANLQSQIVVLPSSLDFGLVEAGVSAQSTLAISNAGPGFLMGSATLMIPDEFSILSGTPFSIASQATTNLTIQFNPLVTGIFSNIVLFSSNGGNSTNLLAGRAIITPMMLSPAMDHGSFTFSFNTAAGFTYIIQFKDDLKDPGWQTLEAQPGDGLVHNFSVPVSGLPQLYYRVLVQ